MQENRIESALATLIRRQQNIHQRLDQLENQGKRLSKTWASMKDRVTDAITLSKEAQAIDAALIAAGVVDCWPDGHHAVSEKLERLLSIDWDQLLTRDGQLRKRPKTT